MMTVKALEVRDRGTCMPVLCVELVGRNPAQQRILWRAGWPQGWHCRIMLIDLNDPSRTQYDPYQQTENPRTLRIAHHHINALWDSLSDGDVIDVEFLEGETESAKVSEIQ